MTSLCCLSLVSFLLGGAFAATLPSEYTLTTPSTCTYNNKTFPTGSFRPTPCEYCHCVNGHAFCAIADCAPPMCVDAVHDPDECCSECPNGSNCAHEGHIIKHGESYYPNASTVCSCPEPHFFFGYGGSNGPTAVCVPVIQPTVPPQPEK